MPTQSHGDPRNIVLTDLTAAAQAGGVSIPTAAANIPRTLRHGVHADWPTTLADILDRPTLVVDIDGVLAFTQEAFAAALYGAFGTQLSAATATVYWLEHLLPPDQAAWLTDQRSQPDVYEHCAPDWHAIDVVNEAKAAGYTVLIATERDPSLAAVTVDWLDRNQVARDAVHVLGHGRKAAFMASLEPPAVLIDDDSAKRQTVPRDGVELWAPPRPWTPPTSRVGVWDFTGWTEVRHRLGLIDD